MYKNIVWIGNLISIKPKMNFIK